MSWKITDYEKLSYGYWVKELRSAKHIINWLLPCYSHCPKQASCKKLIVYREMQDKIRRLLEPTFDESVKDRRMKLRDLLPDISHLKWEIKKCIIVQKHLADRGYNRWYD